MVKANCSACSSRTSRTTPSSSSTRRGSSGAGATVRSASSATGRTKSWADRRTSSSPPRTFGTASPGGRSGDPGHGPGAGRPLARPEGWLPVLGQRRDDLPARRPRGRAGLRQDHARPNRVVARRPGPPRERGPQGGDPGGVARLPSSPSTTTERSSSSTRPPRRSSATPGADALGREMAELIIPPVAARGPPPGPGPLPGHRRRSGPRPPDRVRRRSGPTAPSSPPSWRSPRSRRAARPCSPPTSGTSPSGSGTRRRSPSRRRLAEFGRDVGPRPDRERPRSARCSTRIAGRPSGTSTPPSPGSGRSTRRATSWSCRPAPGLYTHLDGPHGRVPVGRFKIGTIARERRPHLTNSVVGDPRVPDQDWARREGMVAFAGYPLIVEDRLVGVWAMFARHPLSEASLRAMESVAAGIALGIERKRAERGARRERGLARDDPDQHRRRGHRHRRPGHVRFMNPVAEALTGWPQAEAAGRPMDEVFRIVNEQTRQPVESPVAQVLREGVVGRPGQPHRPDRPRRRRDAHRGQRRADPRRPRRDRRRRPGLPRRHRRARGRRGAAPQERGAVPDPDRRLAPDRLVRRGPTASSTTTTSAGYDYSGFPAAVRRRGWQPSLDPDDRRRDPRPLGRGRRGAARRTRSSSGCPTGPPAGLPLAPGPGPADARRAGAGRPVVRHRTDIDDLQAGRGGAPGRPRRGRARQPGQGPVPRRPEPRAADPAEPDPAGRLLDARAARRPRRSSGPTWS